MGFQIYKIPLNNIATSFKEGLKLDYSVSFTNLVSNVNVAVVNGTCDKTVINSSIVSKLLITPDKTKDYVLLKLEATALNLSIHTITLTLDKATYSESGDSYQLKQSYAPINTLTNKQQFKVNFNHTEEVKMDMILQSSYDNTINVIFADGVGPARLVNTGVEFKDNLAIIPPNITTYDANSLYTTELIPKYNKIPNVKFNGTFAGGNLKAGGYKYYFKYATRDGVETDIIEESRLVSVHFGSSSNDSHGGLPNEETDKYVSFTLTNLDPAYKKVKVYYTYYTGDVAPTGSSFKILSDFNIEDDKCNVIHTGYESTETKTAESISKPYNYADVVKTLTTANNRLLLGNMSNSSLSNEILSAAALHCTVSAEKKYSSGFYTNPNTIYDGISYWDGETYEFGIVFITNAGNSEVYPIMGIDGTVTETYDNQYKGKKIDNHFIESTGQNDLGIFRFPCTESTKSFAGNSSMQELYPKFDTSYLRINKQSLKDSGVLGYFFVKRKRKPDLLVEGLVAPTTTVYMNTMTNQERLVMNGCNYIGLGANDSGKEPTSYSKSPLGTKYVYVPAMYGAMPFTNDIFDVDKPGLYSSLIFAPVFRFENFTKYAMYSPDFVCAEPTFVSEYPGGNDIHWKFDGITAGNSHYEAYYEAFPLLDFTQDERNTIVYNIYATNTFTAKRGSNHGNGTAQYISTGQLGVKPAGFTGSTDRQLWTELSISIGTDGNKPSKSRQDGTVNDMFKANLATSTYVEGAHGFIVGLRDDRDPYKIWGSSANYNGYLGIDINNDELNSVIKEHCLPTQSADHGQQKNYFCSLFKYPYTYPLGGQAKAGAYVRLYSTGAEDGYLTPQAWRSRYLSASGEPYHAISNRYDLNVTSDIVASSGDCFVDMFSQQLFFSKGIAGAPTANDPAGYFGYANGNTREAINMAPIGLCSKYPMRSNYNFTLRSLEEADATETKLYSTKRGFIPLNNARQQYGNRQFETRKYNHGHSAQQESVLQYYRYDADRPYTQYNYTNRISVSSAGVEGTFTNGFRDFSGLNFKDYNKELGEIVAIREVQGKVYIIFEEGISVINVDERSMLSTNTGSVYTDSVNVLSPQAQVISSTIGTLHKTSVISSDNAIYGVDSQQHKIWRIAVKGVEPISDFKIQKLVTQFSKADDLIDIYTTYNVLKREIQFTFIGKSGISSVVFNELLNIWVTPTDIHKLYSANLDGKNWFMGTKTGSTAFAPKYRLVRTIDNAKCMYKRIDGTLDILPFSFSFIVNHDPGMSKIVDSIFLNGSTNYPTQLTLSAEFVDEYTQDLTYTSNAYKPTYFKVSTISKNIMTVEVDNPPNTDWASMYRFNVGDLLTIINPDKTIVKTSISYVNGTTLYLSSVMESTIQQGASIINGWKLATRLINAEAEDNKTKIQIWRRSKVLSAAGDRRNSRQYMMMDSDTRLRGHWCKIDVKSNDFSPFYINSIDSLITKSYS